MNTIRKMENNNEKSISVRLVGKDAKKWADLKNKLSEGGIRDVSDGDTLKYLLRTR